MARPRSGGPEPQNGEELALGIRDRVLELRRVPSEELQDNEANWRVHPYAQRAAVAELLERVGIVGALTAYHSDRNGGKLTLIDGHERKGHQADWPVLILDVDDDEADLLLLTLDPLAAMAESSAAQLDRLLEDARFGTPALEDVLHELQLQARGLAEEEEQDGKRRRGRRADGPMLPEMELQPYEHYDYVVLLCRNTYDWMALHDLLGLQEVQFTLPDESKRIGLGRVVDARRLIDLMRERDAAG